MAVRIFLVDDHEIVRRGVAELLTAGGEFDVVGEAGTVEQALARLAGAEVDVAVLDVRLPDGNGVELCREIRSRYPHVACLMLTSFSDDEALLDAAMAGAQGFVLKQLRGTDIVDAVRTVATGKSLIDPATTKRALARLEAGSEADRTLAPLTEQERKIFHLIGDGKSNRQIAEEMYLAEKTVKNYVSTMLGKLGVESRTQAAIVALKRAPH